MFPIVRRLGRAAVRRFDRATMTDVASLKDAIEVLTARVQELQRAHEHEMKWRARLRRDLQAVLRHEFLQHGGPLDSAWLNATRFGVRSQNEEDGIVLTLLREAGTTQRRFVEIGCGRSGGNSAILAYEFGWTGVMVDASKKAVTHARATFSTNPKVAVVHAIVTPDNINTLLDAHGSTGEVDLLSIDVDSVDYWLLDALDAASPRVLAMEYNALFGPTRALTLPNRPVPEGAPKAYHGASLAALEKLARRKGYRLVVCEDTGVNAFFLREDVATHLAGLTACQAFRPARHRRSVDGNGTKVLDLIQLCERLRLPLVEV
jgi:hypothetical protein